MDEIFGGIVDKATFALIGEAGKEAVMPLENNTGWIDQLAGDILDRMNRGGDIYNSTNDARTYNFVQNNTSPRALSRLEIYRQTKRMLRAAKGVE